MTVVVSDEKKAHVMRQVGIGKASASEPLRKRRNNQDDIRTGEFKSLRDEPGGCPLVWPGGPAYRRREPDLQLLLQFPGGGQAGGLRVAGHRGQERLADGGVDGDAADRRCRRFLPSMRCPVPVQ